MEIRQIDHLFKNKLKTAKVDPKIESWDRLEAMLDADKPKGMFWTWKVAAVILVLLVAAFAIKWGITDRSVQQLAVKQGQETITKNLIDTNNVLPLKIKNETEVVAKLIQTEVKELKKPLSEKVNELEIPKQLKTEEVTITEMQETVALNEVDAQMKVDSTDERKKLPIRITFKRNTIQSEKQLAMVNSESDTTNNKGFKEFLDKTRQLNPSELMADIRDAKDEFLSDPFNIKKNKVKNSNK